MKLDEERRQKKKINKATSLGKIAGILLEKKKAIEEELKREEEKVKMEVERKISMVQV
jgi:hypothetical protein